MSIIGQKVKVHHYEESNNLADEANVADEASFVVPEGVGAPEVHPTPAVYPWINNVDEDENNAVEPSNLVEEPLISSWNQWTNNVDEEQYNAVEPSNVEEEEQIPPTSPEWINNEEEETNETNGNFDDEVHTVDRRPWLNNTDEELFNTTDGNYDDEVHTVDRRPWLNNADEPSNTTDDAWNPWTNNGDDEDNTTPVPTIDDGNLVGPIIDYLNNLTQEGNDTEIVHPTLYENSQDFTTPRGEAKSSISFDPATGAETAYGVQTVTHDVDGIRTTVETRTTTRTLHGSTLWKHTAVRTIKYDLKKPFKSRRHTTITTTHHRDGSKTVSTRSESTYYFRNGCQSGAVSNVTKHFDAHGKEDRHPAYGTYLKPRICGRF